MGGASDSGGAGDPLPGCLGRNGSISVVAEDSVHLCRVCLDFFQRLECLPTAGMLRPSQFFPAAAGTVLAASADTADSPLYRAGALALPGDVESASAFLGGLGDLQ